MPRGLVEVLRALPQRELASLIERLGISVDPAKRIDVPSQVARVLVNLPEAKDPACLPGPTRELVYRIAEAGGVLTVPSLPQAVEPLVARGLVFVRAGGRHGIELLLPIAYMVQLRSWEGEDPRGIRPLLAQTNPDVAASVAGHYLGRPAIPPVALSLEAAWAALTDPERLLEELEALAPMERKLLQAIEEVGGEVDTEELLDLEREPMRLRGATGATQSRRGVGFALERRGFLIPVHPNRHVVPSEVVAVVGARRREEREQRRREIRSFVLAEDHAPRRARFAEDPAPLALAMAMAVREPGIEVRADVGTPRSLINKLAARFGRSPDHVALIATLSRAIGLWDASASHVNSPPGSECTDDLGMLLFRAWRRGGAWDEARPGGEVLRFSSETREASAVGVLREMVLEALQDLGDGRWVPWEAIAGFIRTDSRTPGIARLLDRWAHRAGCEPMTPAEIASRVVFDSLHRLGFVDLGDADGEETDDGDDGVGPTVRITPRGRAALSGSDGPGRRVASSFLDNQALRIGAGVRIGEVLALTPFTEIGRVAGDLDLTITQAALSRALSAGLEAQVIKARLSAIAPLPDPIARLLAQASAVLGRAEYVPSEGFLWVDDPEVREMLRTRRQTADLFVDPSPPGGLLLVQGADLDRVTRRCRTLGVEVVVDGHTYRTRSTAPPRRAPAPGETGVKGRAPNKRLVSGTRRRYSASQMAAQGAKRTRQGG